MMDVQHRVARRHFHPDRARQLSGEPPDRAEADEPERLSRDLAPRRQRGPRPRTGSDRRSGLVDPAQKDHRGSDDVLGHR